MDIFWTHTLWTDVGIISIIKQRLEDIELQRWFSEMNNDTRKDPNQSNKMRTYRKVKKIDNYRCEDYLHQVTNIRHRTTMTKQRLSNHRLAIETGRYMRPYRNRIYLDIVDVLCIRHQIKYVCMYACMHACMYGHRNF